MNLIRLAALLRRQRFRTVWVLDRTVRPALAARLAGVPERIGLGLGAQKLFITNPGLDLSHFHDHPIDWLRALMTAMNVPLPSTEPALPVRADLRAAIGTKFGASPRPWIVLGLGAMDPARDWSESSWLEFLNAVRTVTGGTVFLIGGAANAARVQSLIARTSGSAAINACELGLGEALALLSYADVFVGTDSGPMNLAAAVGTPALVMFGVNRVLDYSKFIHPIVPDGGPCPDGMTKITPAAVLEHIRPFIRRGEAGAG
jgi:heptosyltransferase-2